MSAFPPLPAMLRAKTINLLVGTSSGTIAQVGAFFLKAPVTYAKTSGNANLAVSSGGAVSATSGIAAGQTQQIVGNATGADGVRIPWTMNCTAQGVPAAASWRLATVRGGELAFGSAGTSNSAVQRNTFRQKDKLGPATYQKLKFVDVGFSVSSANVETALGQSFTIARAVEISAAVQGVTWSAAASVSVPSGSTGVESDEYLPSLFGLSAFAPNTDIWLRSRVDAYFVNPSYGNYLQFPAVGAGTPAGEGGYRTSTATDQLLATGALAAGGTAMTVIGGAAARVIGYASDHGPTVLVLGDSRFYGFHGTDGVGTGTAGGPARMALEAAGLPHEMQARSTTQLSQLMTYDGGGNPTGIINWGGRLNAVQYVSDVIGNWGTNDIQAGVTGSQLTARVQYFVAYLKTLNPLVRVWWTTIAPRTNTSNMPAAGFANSDTNGRKAFNDYLKANFAAMGLAGVVDVSAACEGATTDTWRTDITGVLAGTSDDGVHSVQAQQVNEAAVIQSWAGALPAPL